MTYIKNRNAGGRMTGRKWGVFYSARKFHLFHIILKPPGVPRIINARHAIKFKIIVMIMVDKDNKNI